MPPGGRRIPKRRLPSTARRPECRRLGGCISDSTATGPVENWFGPHFHLLHPALRALPSRPSRLTGPVRVAFGKGLGRRLGMMLARKLGVPPREGEHDMEVRIYSDAA